MHQTLLLVVLLLPASLGSAEEQVPPSVPSASVTSESVSKPSPELASLYRSLTEALQKKQAGLSSAQDFDRWTRSYRQTLTETMTRVPATPANAALHAEILSRLGDSKQALAGLDAALKMDPNDPKLLVAKGNVYFDAKDFTGASAAAAAALKSDPRDKAALWLKFAGENRVAPRVRLPGSPWESPDQAPGGGSAAATPEKTLDRGWAASDFARANAAMRAQAVVPTGKLDRGVPSLAGIGAEVVANSPFGPLAEHPTGKGAADPIRTAGTLALTATGALLLFGGLGGKKLEETVPGIRKGMGIAALIGGTLATGAVAWEAYAARVAVAVPLAAHPEIEEKVGSGVPELSALESEVVTDGAIPRSAAQGARLQEHLRQLQRYGSDGYRELENGTLRYYGQLRQARTPGNMDGMRVVREWNPSTGLVRTWMETVDRTGAVRIVRPETGVDKVHYYFSGAGEYLGSK